MNSGAASHRFRFSLRTLLLATTVVACAAGLVRAFPLLLGVLMVLLCAAVAMMLIWLEPQP